MNRWRGTDSFFELDLILRVRNTLRMPQDMLQLLVLDRRDASANMDRFYVLAIEESLFGDAALIREWGRIGTRGRRRIELYRDRGGAMEALETWLRRKQRRGYQIRAKV